MDDQSQIIDGAVNGSNNGTPKETGIVIASSDDNNNPGEKGITINPAVNKKPKWKIWAVNANAGDNELIEAVYNEFLQENPGATKSDFVKARLLSNQVNPQPAPAKPVIEFPDDLPGILKQVICYINTELGYYPSGSDAAGLMDILQLVKPIIDARVTAGITVNEIHFLKQCVDFAVNYNTQFPKLKTLQFAVPAHDIKVPGGFYNK